MKRKPCLTIYWSIIILGSLIISSCDQLSGEEATKKLEIKDTLVFKVPSFLSTRWSSIGYVEIEKGIQGFAVHDVLNSNQLALFNHEGEFLKNLEFDKNLFGKIYSIHWINSDSILLINKYKYQIHLTNSASVLLKTYSTMHPNRTDDSVLAQKIDGGGIIYHEGKVYISGFPDKEPYNDKYTSAFNLISINLRSEKIDYHVSFPKIYRDTDGFFGMEHAMIRMSKSKNSIVYCFPIDQNFIYSLKFTDETLESHRVKETHNVKDVQPMVNYTEDFQTYTKFQLTADQYSGIQVVSDDEIVRFFELGLTEEAAEEAMTNKSTLEVPDRGLQIFDGNYSLKGEYILPRGLSVRNSLVIGETLWLKDFENSTDDAVIYYRVI